MNKLKAWADGRRGRISELSKALDVPYSFVFKMALGEKAIPMSHGAAIEQFTGGAVTRKDMFPDTWQRIWPELANSSVNQPTPTGQGDSNVQI
jgi:DNA-binding transcriptional regulator YdaS (Cro superfamily)